MWIYVLYSRQFPDELSCLLPLAPQVIGIVRATDKDEHLASYRFSLASQSSNFSLRDYGSKSYTPSCRFVRACCSKRRSELPHLLPRNRWKCRRFCCRQSKVNPTSKSIFLVLAARRRDLESLSWKLHACLEYRNFSICWNQKSQRVLQKTFVSFVIPGKDEAWMLEKK